MTTAQTAAPTAAEYAARLVANRQQFEREQKEARRVAEANFQRDVTRYIAETWRFQCGGVTNLLSIVAGACEEQSRMEGDDYEKAAKLIDDCAAACDLKYAEPSDEPDENTNDTREIHFPSRVRSGL